MLPTSTVDERIRRLLDVVASSVGLLLLSPLLLAMAVLIKLDSAGTIFYRARRVGKDARVFQLYKFRTMVPDADRKGPGITGADDPRVTRMGCYLRRTKLDELPQLINVIKGDMSLVGPRPEDPRYVALYTPEQRQILSVRPGITSAASLAYRHEQELLAGPDWEATYLTEIMPAKLTIDLAYLRDRTVASDVRLVLQTALSVLR